MIEITVLTTPSHWLQAWKNIHCHSLELASDRNLQVRENLTNEFRQRANCKDNFGFQYLHISEFDAQFQLMNYEVQ